MPVRKLLLAPVLLCPVLFAADYKGPLPPKPDLPYLLHASDLVPTEAVTASQSSQKKSSTFTIQGASSAAKTPLAEPIFILETKSLDPASLELWRFEVRNGERSVSVTGGVHHKGASGPYHLSVTKIGDRLYRLEAQEMLENGEYSLSPAGSNQAFCFQIY
ncbi:MAG: hypothetical protein ABSB67_08775 [Bryobacteraceae bacterium]|jgi:hypothetical protein